METRPQTSNNLSTNNLLFLGGIFLLHILLVLVNWKFTWDDSAITLAYARNLVLYGELVPSEFYGRVEGFSSLLWMFQNSFFFRLGLEPATVVNLAKTITLLLNIVNGLLLFWLSRKLYMHKYLSMALVLVFMLSSVTIMESLNGMETPLYLFLILMAVIAFIRKGKTGTIIFYLSTTLLLFIRYEAAWFLLPFFIYDILHWKWKVFLKPYYYLWAVVFVIEKSWRYFYFGEIFTNPVIAKQNPPYTPEFATVLHWFYFHLHGIFSVGIAWIFLFAGVLVLLFFHRKPIKVLWEKFFNHNSEHGKLLLLSVLFIIASLILNFIIGRNWGPLNRMFFPGLPFLLLLVFSIFNLLPKIRFFNISIAIAVFLTALTNLAILSWELESPVTIQNVKIFGDAVTHLHQLSGIEKPITYAAPDMGGVLLFTENLRVIDIGLLCNLELASEGYIIFEHYIFGQEQPEILCVHNIWTKASGIYQMESLYSDYSPAVVKGKLFYLRNSFLQTLPEGTFETSTFHNLELAEIDKRILERFGRVLVMKSREQQ